MMPGRWPRGDCVVPVLLRLSVAALVSAVALVILTIAGRLPWATAIRSWTQDRLYTACRAMEVVSVPSRVQMMISPCWRAIRTT